MNLFFRRFLNSRNVFPYSILIILVVYLITRLQYFLYYPVLFLSSDSASYCAIAFNILNRNSLLFDIRTPGYPFLLSLVWIFSKSVYTVAIIQSLFTIITSVFFIWVINKTYKSLTLLFAICLSAYISSTYFILLEDYVLTEGIYVSMLILSSAFLILSLKKNKLYSWFLLSVSIGIIVLIRPAGLFLCSVILLILLFFLSNKYKIKYYLALVLPFISIVLILCAYNYITLNSFTISPFGGSNLMGATILFMEPSKDYPQFVNEAIVNTLDSIPRKDISYVKDSYGISKLYHTFNNDFFMQVILTENLMKQDNSLSFVKIQPFIKEISFDAIKKHPGIYAKFVVSNFIFFFANLRTDVDYYEQLKAIYTRTTIDKKYISELASGRWRQVSSGKQDNSAIISFFSDEIEKQKNLDYIKLNKDDIVELKSTVLMILYMIYAKINNIIFRNFLWLLLYFVILIFSFYICLKSRLKSVDAFIPFVFAMMFLSNAVLVSLVEVSLTRYSYTVEFVIFFSLPFLILLLKNFYKKQSI